MSTPDVVAELNEWLHQWRCTDGHPPWPDPLLQRARDEIVALREDVAMYKRMAIEAISKAQDGAVVAARAEALEEAARECEAAKRSRPSRWVTDEDRTIDGVWRNAHDHCIAAIRAMKDKTDE
jgi:hypothetical protein